MPLRSRRAFLARGLLGVAGGVSLAGGIPECLLGRLLEGRGGPFDLVSPFVSTCGRRFTRLGLPFPAVGANSFWLSYRQWDRQVVDEVLGELRGAGQRTLRVWGFGSSSSDSFHPAPGEFNEAAFERLDYLIERARAYGIRLVVVLSNYWHDFGGIDTYVDWSETADKRDDFYTDDRSQELYRSFVEYVLTRENTRTGVEYRDDPTIMMWELMNEPRYGGARDSGDGVVESWIDETAAFVKDLDPNHLVSTGTEGFGNVGPDVHPTDLAAGIGYDLVDAHRSSSVDAVSLHMYPEHWEVSPAGAADLIGDTVRHVSDVLDKPVYVGEFGYGVDRDVPDVDDRIEIRNERFRQWYDVLADAGADGACVWQFVPSHLLEQADEYAVVAPGDNSTMAVIEDGSHRL